MLKKDKLGRNPLDRLHGKAKVQEVKRVQSRLEVPPPSVFTLLQTQIKSQTALEKIKEMQIQVNWHELYQGTLGRQIKKWSRFF